MPFTELIYSIYRLYIHKSKTHHPFVLQNILIFDSLVFYNDNVCINFSVNGFTFFLEHSLCINQITNRLSQG